MQNLAETLKDPQRQVAVMARLSAYYWQIGKLNQAEDTARQALQMAQENDDRPGQLSCLEQIARIFWTRRDDESMIFATESPGDCPRVGRSSP